MKLDNTSGNIPVSTKWLLDSVGDIGRETIKSVFMIVCHKRGSKGTGFLHKSGYIVTNHHVVSDSSVEDIIAVSSAGEKIEFERVISDKNRDLALLKPKIQLTGGLELGTREIIKPGIQVSAWGFPLGYNGPAPLLTTGYVSGFMDRPGAETTNRIKHIVVNGAFNPGNSGGPLFVSGSDKVVGIVVSKHAPIPPFLRSAITALANNQSGVLFTATDEKGNRQNFVESQIVAELLGYYHSLTQVVIGEAIAEEELAKFLEEHKIQ